MLTQVLRLCAVLLLTAAIPLMPSRALQANGATVSAWGVYWDTEDVAAELRAMPALSSFTYFAAYFGADDTLFLPKGLEQLCAGDDIPAYLSIVNDKVYADGKSVQKDAEPLKAILRDKRRVKAHIEEIAALAKDGGYAGVEIDYEKLHRVQGLYSSFLDFCESLYDRLSKEGIALRVLLEPSTPVSEHTFPEGPEYTMMCYNLHGYGTAPGPKATPAFIEELAESVSSIPGKKSFAFSTGGFDWPEGGSVAALTETEAAALAASYKVTPRRDAQSGCLYFGYRKDGVKHTVWYADGETLLGWMKAAADLGYADAHLWRLGGNGAESLRDISKAYGH